MNAKLDALKQWSAARWVQLRDRAQELWTKLKPWLVPDLEFDAEGDLRRIQRAGLVVVGVFFVGFGAWAMVAPLAGAVIAPGFIKVDMNRKTLRHQEGGIVKEILVRDGQHVLAGQSLVVLGDVRVDASLELLRAQHDGEVAKQARLTAEKAFEPKLQFPATLMQRATDTRVAEVLTSETNLFNARRQLLDDQVRLLRTQIDEAQREAKAFEAMIAAEERAVKLQKEELAFNETLMKQNYVHRARIITLERAVAEYEARASEHRAELSKTKGRSTDIELRIVSARNQYMQTAADELAVSTNRLFDIEERLRPSLDAETRQRIVAPIAGEVTDLKVWTVGAPIGPREPLMDIVPLERTLIVEAMVQVQDIAHVHVGSEVEVQLNAFKQRTTPLVIGKVIYVSADRLMDEKTQVPYYRVHASITPEALKKAGDLQLHAGMPADIFVKTKERTVLDYWVEPLTAHMRRAWREL